MSVPAVKKNVMIAQSVYTKQHATAKNEMFSAQNVIFRFHSYFHLSSYRTKWFMLVVQNSIHLLQTKWKISLFSAIPLSLFYQPLWISFGLRYSIFFEQYKSSVRKTKRQFFLNDFIVLPTFWLCIYFGNRTGSECWCLSVCKITHRRWQRPRKRNWKKMRKCAVLFSCYLNVYAALIT